MAKPKEIPFSFVLEKLDRLDPVIKPMFGCYAIYSGDKMLFMLREKETADEDNGVWVATAIEHHESLKKIFPSIRSVSVLGKPPTAWQNIPSTADDFEESVLLACDLALKNDKRIGKIPKAKAGKKTTRRRASKNE